ncbi:CHAP domain-containing protein [Vibrio parahaemolyticus]|nr:CHAP domain-containing protein [Vibrio parahaemolyticus]HCH1624391.1 CHAP domain-containing protein [Vibrio parahaemolyticus]
MNIKIKIIISFVSLITLTFIGYKMLTNINLNSKHKIGEILDSLNDVSVYYNGGVNHVLERNLTDDGYNLGLKYQCVEFVKRYYYEYLNHKMPDTYGHAKDFFNLDLADGDLNKQRNLIQYGNGSLSPPKVSDILVYKSTITNPYGHVAIVSKVDLSGGYIEVIQQNPGPFSQSRERYLLESKNDKWVVKNERVLGWLHKI